MNNKDRNKKPRKHYKRRKEATPKLPKQDGLMRLNKYIAHAGVCSRRQADVLIQTGVVRVNGEIVTELGVKVKPTDKVQLDGQTLSHEKKKHLLLNKPKNYITTLDDPRNRNIVTSLIDGACKERLYPVGRLDRNTTGLLLFTNDGDLTKKLTHPKYNVKKLYHVVLDKNIGVKDFNTIQEGFMLDDGLVKPDSIAFVQGLQSKKHIGIEIHSGRNRIVRRVFEHFGYKVTKLDRVIFSGLTKKNLPRGKWRFLTEKEVIFLKNFS